MRGNTYANRYRKFGEWAVIGLERTGSWIDRASTARRLSSHMLFLLGLPLTAWVWVGADFWPWGLPAAASVPLASALLLPTPPVAYTPLTLPTNQTVDISLCR